MLSDLTFGGDYLTGMLVVAFITVTYTFIGGFLAVSYTDAVQGMIMFCSLIIVPVMALLYLEDPSSIWTWATSNSYGPHADGNPQYYSLISGISAATIINLVKKPLNIRCKPVRPVGLQ